MRASARLNILVAVVWLGFIGIIIIAILRSLHS